MREGWNSIKLVDAVEILNGFAFKSSRYVPEGIRVIRISNVQKGYVEDKDPKFYPVSSKDEIKKYLLQEGDLLISLTGNVGRVGLLPDSMLPCALNQRVACLRIKNANLSKMFLFYLLNSNVFENMCIKSSSGVAQLNMSTEWLKEQVIPLPSLPEQQRIVDILDREFAKIDALKANAEKSLQAAKDLFQASLKKELEPKEGWKVKTIGEVCEFQNGFAFKSSTFTNTGEPIIRISDIQNDEVIDTNVVFFNPSSYREDLSRFIVYPGDILIAMSGGTTGKLGMNNTQKCFYLNQRVGVFRENKALLNHEFLFHFLHTKSEESLRISAGAAQPNLSTAQIKAFEIPVPSLQEQDRVVVRLNDLNDKCKALQDNYQKTLTLCDDLKQSLLRKAFNGEL